MLVFCRRMLILFWGFFLFDKAWLALSTYYITIAIILFKCGDRDLMKSFLRGWNHVLGITGIILAGLCGVVIVTIWPMAKLDHVNLSIVLTSLGLSRTLWLVSRIFVLTVNPFLEEAFWRGCFE